MGSQRVRYNLATKQQHTDWRVEKSLFLAETHWDGRADYAQRSRLPISLCMRTDSSGWTQCLIYHILKKKLVLVCWRLSPHFLPWAFLTDYRCEFFSSDFHAGSEWTFSYCSLAMVILSLSVKLSGSNNDIAALYWVLSMLLRIRATPCEPLMVSQLLTFTNICM